MTLRALEPDDLDYLYLTENDRTLWDVSSTTVPYSRRLLADFILSTTGNIYADGQVRMIIEDDDHNIVGLADIIDFDPKNLRAELGLVISPQFRGRGLSHQALALIDDYASSVIHLHQLYCYVSEENIPSLSMLRKMNYKEGAILQDWLFDGTKYHNVCLMQKFF